MHRTEALRPSVVDDPTALAARMRRRARGEAAEAIAAAAILAMVLGSLAGWRLPI